MTELKSRSPSSSSLGSVSSSNSSPLLPLTIFHSPSSSSEEHSTTLKISVALFYAFSSTVIIFINKIILTSYHFHHFYILGATQFLVTCLILILLSSLKFLEIPRFTFSIFKEIFPVFLLFFGNVMCGLGSTQSLNLPMFTVLRRFSILMSLIGEYYLLSTIPSTQVVCAVFLMIAGAIIAALFDFSYDPYGYGLVLLNDFFTALNGIYLKKATISKRCSKMGIMFYNSLLSFLSLVLYSLWSHLLLTPSSTSSPSALVDSSSISVFEEVLSFPGWNDPSFVLLFIFTAIMGSVLNYSIFLCTTINSPLTTAVVGCLKNILVTYFSMIFLSSGGVGGEGFSLCNFIGLNISILGSVYYTAITMKPS
jgi:hypothetical protein